MLIRIAQIASFLAVTVFLIVSSAFAADTKKSDFIKGELFPNIVASKLDNGMEVVVIPDQRATAVTHMVWYKVGSADEDPGKSGIAHFLEHLLFKGTKKYPGNALDTTVRRVGGNHNAFTSYDYTGYFQKITREHLPLMMDIEADRMMNVRFTEEDVDVERKVVLEERARGIESRPGSQLSAAMDLALYKNHPYRRPIIGWRHELEVLNQKDAFAFYEKYYTPANAILVVSGNVTVEEVQAMAQKYYGVLKNRAPAAKRVRPIEPDDLLMRQLITVRDPRITNESVSILFRVPSFRTGKPGTSEALYLLSEILSGTTRSRIYKSFVVDRQIATSAGAYSGASALDDSSFTIYGTPKGDVTLEEMEKQLLDEIKRVAKEGVTEKELQRARNRLFASTIYAQDSASGLANLMGRTLSVDSTLADIRSWPDRIRNVSIEDIKEAAATYFNPEKAVIGHLRRPLETDKDPS